MNTKENIFDLHLISQSSEFIGHTFSSYFLPNEEESIIYLPNTNKINIFIGTNNSGKSRFMRELLKMEDWYFSKDLYSNIRSYYDSIETLFENHLNNTLNKNKYFFDIKGEKITQLKYQISIIKNDHLPVIYNAEGYRKVLSNLNKIQEPNRKNNFKKIFIPTLRSAHSLFNTNSKKIEEDFYQETLIKNYKFKTDIQKIEIFTGLHLYKKILNARNSNKDNRRRFEEFEKFISQNFFNGKAIDIVAEYNFDSNLKGENSDNNIIIHIDGETDRKLYDLGDGIQALIVLMFPIFMAENETYVFIDEPEINLHPGMQRLFLNQICNNDVLKKKNLTYFISTHSNHFLDLSIEKENVSIYSFSERKSEKKSEKHFEIRNVNQGDNSILKQIGVTNSSVFLANCSIWVEGVSDRNYIKAFLNSYIKDEINNAKILKEDIDFAFFEYAGSNIEHYIFEELDPEELEIKESINALALNNNIFLLADSDNVKKGTKKFDRIEALETNNKITTHIIKNIREIENILTDEIWIKAIPFYCNTNLLKNHCEEITIKISEALKTIKPLKYKKKYIGEFLNTLRTEVGQIGSEFIINKSVYKTNRGTHGTLVNKRELSEFIVKEELSWEIYKKSPDIVALTEAVYEFILEHKV